MTTVPSAVNFKMRFPAFADADDAVIEFAIEEALRFVDGTWIADDQVLAISYLAAHLLSVADVSADSGGRTITSERIGPLSESYSVSGSVQTDWLRTTSYGERHLEYRRRSRGGPLVV